jgi:beta-N-acetylhexosaminidase
MMKKREKKGLMRIVSLCTAGLVLLTACGGSGGNGREGQDAQGSAMTSAEAVAEASASAGASDDAAGTDPAVPAEASDAGTADAADAVGNADAPAGTGDTAAAAGSAVSAVPGAEDTEAAVDEAALAAEADRILGGMSMDEKISQMIIPAIRTWDEQDVTDLGQVPALAEALRRHQYGGIILFSGNVIGNGQTAKLIADLQANNAQIEGVSTSIPYFMPVDEEGGIVVRLGTGTRMTGNMAIGATGDRAKDNALATGIVLGEEMAALGFNVDYAPDIDVNNNPANPVIGPRSFSDDPQLVAELGEAFARGLAQNHIIATYKHFPGHGDTSVDSHIGTPSVDKTYEELRETELVPFESAIKNGADMIMTAHITYPAIDEEQTYGDGVTKGFYPATMSRKMITEILRGDMGYDGVVVTDAMEMGAIDAAGLVPGEQGSLEYHVNVAEKVINAGVDILLIPMDLNSAARADFYDQYVAALAEMTADGRISETRIDESVGRILRLKLKYGILEGAEQKADVPENAEFGMTGETADTGESAGNAASASTGTASGTGAAEAGEGAEQAQEMPALTIESVGSDAHHLKEMEIARQAVTVVRNEGQTLPAVTSGKKIVLLGRQVDDIPALNYYVQLLQEEGALAADAQITIETYLDTSGEETVLRYTDEMRQAIQDADLVVGMTRTDILDALAAGAPQYEGIHRAIEDTHAGGGSFVLLSENLPYDAARFQDADAIVLAYMGSGLMDPTEGGTAGRQLAGNANVPAALETIFGFNEPAGRLPVNVPVIESREDGTLSYGSDILYERGFGLSFE